MSIARTETNRGETIALALLLPPFAAAAVYQWNIHLSGLFGDYNIYRSAAQRAWQGIDPYAPHSIGWGFLYPSPSLLAFRAIDRASPAGSDGALVFMFASAICAAAAIALLMGKLTFRGAIIGGLLLVSAGTVETVERGQVNALVLLAIVLFFRWWERQWRVPAALVLSCAVALKVTPLVYGATFLQRRSVKYLGICAAALFVQFVAAELLIPAPHPTESFLQTLGWAAQQGPANRREATILTLANYSLSVVPSSFGLVDAAVSWQTVHLLKVSILAVVLLLAVIGYARSSRSQQARRALWATSSVCMVLAPNIVWLHHEMLLIPAFWFMLNCSHPSVRVMTLSALVAFQATRVANGIMGTRAAFFFAGGELLILFAALLHLVLFLAGESPRLSIRSILARA